MNGLHETLARQLRDTVLTSRGATEPALRQAVEARAATLGGRQELSAGHVPETLAAYVDAVARHAYTVTDQDVQALRSAGYSEDAIFEITVSAAVGAGLGRLERGLAALKGER